MPDEKGFEKHFLENVYTDKTRVTAGSVVFELPDHMKYASSGEDPEALLGDQYVLLAVPEEFEGSPREYQEAPFGICLYDGTYDSGLDALWSQDEETVHQALVATTKSTEDVAVTSFDVHYFRLDEQLAVVYMKADEGLNPEKYWRSYAFAVSHRGCGYSGMVFFRGRLQDDSRYERSLNDLFGRIRPAGDAVIEACEVAAKARLLGYYAGANQKIDGIKAAELFAEDVLVFDDETVSFEDGHNHVGGMAVNMEKGEQYAEVAAQDVLFLKCVREAADYTETNDTLVLPASLVHEELLAKVWGRDVTGTSMLRLCQEHWIRISNFSGDEYLVTLDGNLVRGLPKAYDFTAEFLQTLREYNGLGGDFRIHFNTVEGDRESLIRHAVRGADLAPAPEAYEVTAAVHPYEGIAAALEPGGAYDQKEAALIADVEQRLDKDARDTFRGGIPAMLAAYREYADKLEQADSTSMVFDQTEDMVDYVTNLLPKEKVRASYFALGDKYTVSMAYDVRELVKRGEAGTEDFIYNVQMNYGDAGDAAAADDLRERMAARLKELTEDGIYRDFLKGADQTLASGTEILLRERAEREAAEAKAAVKRAIRKARRRKRIIACSIIAAIVLVIILAVVNVKVIKPAKAYDAAVALAEEGSYDEAVAAFTELGDYRDSQDQISRIGFLKAYDEAKALMDSGDLKGAIAAFEALGDYEDAASITADLKNQVAYAEAGAILESGDLAAAVEAYTALGSYEDSASIAADLKNQIAYGKAEALLEAGKRNAAARAFAALDGYSDSWERSRELWKDFDYTRQIVDGLDHGLGVKKNGTVVTSGSSYRGKTWVDDWTAITDVAAGKTFSIGLRSNGTVLASGSNDEGQMQVRGWNNVTAIDAGDYFSVALMSDGTAAACGSNGSGQLNVSGWTKLTAISAGGSHTLGLRKNGKVVAAGSNTYGECDVKDWTDIELISAGAEHSVGLKSDGTVVAAGNDRDGQCHVGEWTGIVDIAAGGNVTVGLRMDGTVVACGAEASGVSDVGEWKNIIAVYAGDTYIIGQKTDGSLVCAGTCSSGQNSLTGWTGIQLPR